MLTLLLLSSLISVPQAAGSARTIQIVGTDNMKYSVTRIEATRGETLRLVLETQSKLAKDVMAHNIVVLAKGANAARVNAAAITARNTGFVPMDRKAEILAYTGLAGAGEKVEVTFTLPKEAGTYEFICTFPGHYNLGMKGVIVVR